jgi:hypothetical protein
MELDPGRRQRGLDGAAGPAAVARTLLMYLAETGQVHEWYIRGIAHLPRQDSLTGIADRGCTVRAAR